ncbi:MAG: aldolase [Syntrophorhabdales bacterium]|jgi:fructose-bisphosphate aldolase/6-deoxy-5-ketofructose 1-phosphate synthase
MASEPTQVKVPADVPQASVDSFMKNYMTITRETGRLMLYAGDQKVEHLNDDFFGEGISSDDSSPEHLFRVADKARIGVFATQLGLIARYGRDYPGVPYLVKLNSKTNIVKTSQRDPISPRWFGVREVADFHKNSGLRIMGVGYTIYLGSEYESTMLLEAAQTVYEAHLRGYLTVLWIYPRGKAVKDEKDPHLIAGAAGVAACLGSDFVKVNYPKKEGVNPAEALKEAVLAAGRTKLVCAGGESDDARLFLQKLHDQIHVAGAAGNATGRNVHQKPLQEAIRMCNAIYAVTVEDRTVEEAYGIYTG